MSRGKSVTKLFLDSSQAALFAGVEIHNKPHVAYRYPTAVILIINAWELSLKAYIYKYMGKQQIYNGRNDQHTISFTKALDKVKIDINTKEGTKTFDAIAENLFLLNEYRCSNIHFYEQELEPIAFMLLSKAVLNYDTFLKKYFKKDITKNDNLIILPIGFKLPFDPIDYLAQQYGDAHNDYVNEVIQAIRRLNNSGIQESIVIGFDVYAGRVRDEKNADIVAALSNQANAIPLRKSFRITNDPKAPAIRMEPDLLPLTYSDLIKAIKEKRPDIRLNKKFNEKMKEIKKSPELCQHRYLNPRTQSGGCKDWYSEKVIDILIELYSKNEP